MSTDPRQDAADRAYLADLDAAAKEATARYDAVATNPQADEAEFDERQRAAASAEAYRDEARDWYRGGAELVDLGQQTDADWVHSPEWTAHHDRIDALQMDAQHEEALADNQARGREAGQ
jgi:hypothetical protein